MLPIESMIEEVAGAPAFQQEVDSAARLHGDGSVGGQKAGDPDYAAVSAPDASERSARLLMLPSRRSRPTEYSGNRC